MMIRRILRGLTSLRSLPDPIGRRSTNYFTLALDTYFNKSNCNLISSNFNFSELYQMVLFFIFRTKKDREMGVGQSLSCVGSRRRRVSGWFLAFNILLRLTSPVEGYGGVVPIVMYHHNQNSHYQQNGPPQSHQFLQSRWRDQQWPSGSSSFSHTFTIPRQPNSFAVPKIKYLPRLEPVNRTRWGQNHSVLTRRQNCDGRGNLIQDIGVLAIASGALSTILSIFTASYYSVVGNTISFISGIFSYATAIPSAIITYLAASDRLSYTIANVLSLLSLANTAYSFWSVNFGNKDIFTSQIANVMGVFSLVLSLVNAFPELFDALLHEFTQKNLVKRREIYRFVNNYGCTGDDQTYYELAQDLIREITA